MSVDSGLSGPVEGPVAPAAPRAGTSPRVAPGRATRPGAARADALADAISPPSFRTGRGRPRRRGRRVTRIVRRIELWSVLKIALVFNTIMLGVALGSVALLWGLANTTGLVDDLEGFLRDAGFEDFRFQGERMFEQVAFIGAVGALAATVFMVLATALLNLIAEITGGIKFTVIEEIVEPPSGTPAAATAARPPAPLALPTVPVTGPPVAPPPPGPQSAEPPAPRRSPAPPPPGPSLAKTSIPTDDGGDDPTSTSGGGRARPAAEGSVPAGGRRPRSGSDEAGPPSSGRSRARSADAAPSGGRRSRPSGDGGAPASSEPRSRRSRSTGPAGTDGGAAASRPDAARAARKGSPRSAGPRGGGRRAPERSEGDRPGPGGGRRARRPQAPPGATGLETPPEGDPEL